MSLPFAAEAPANIALIKYMGKAGLGNRPHNPSLSYTLDHLKTRVELTPYDGSTDRWEPLNIPGFNVALSEQGQARFLNHLQFLKNEWGINQTFLVRSGNDFPADCGLASSASSFAALTRATRQAAIEFGKEGLAEDLKAHDLARLSQKGSGSSCRSFFSPWALWDDEGARAVELPSFPMLHAVVILDSGKKMVSSSEAHRRVMTSLLMTGRKERAEERLQILLNALKTGDWQLSWQTVWNEFFDMHALFETSNPPFSYFNGAVIEVLNFLREDFLRRKDGPLVTMDAGANIHLLYRGEQKSLFLEHRIQLKPRGRILSSLKEHEEF